MEKEIKRYNKRYTTEIFIDTAKQIHGDKYDYSKVEYINNKTKICIICPEHGEFWQKPIKHIVQKQGCPKCSKYRRSTTEEFVNKAKKIHGDKYDYSKVEYINNQTKVTIICPIHGEFIITPHKHLFGQGCKECGKIKNRQNNERIRKECSETFVEKAKKIHGDKYDYSKVEYFNSQTKVIVTCPEHGDFFITPDHHLQGTGCKECGRIKVNILNREKSLRCADEFVNKSVSIHGCKYDYSKVEYINSQTKVCIICPIHGEFWQRPAEHLRGHGCLKCSDSNLEKGIEILLVNNNIRYESQKTFDWLKYKNNLRLDFYLPEYNIAIECQGQQHYIPVDFGSEGNNAGNKKLEETVERDLRKYKLCMENGVKLYYYTEYKGVNENNITFKNKNCLFEYINIVDGIYNDLKKYDNSIILENKNTILYEKLKYKIRFVRLTLIERNQLLLEKEENTNSGYKTIFIFENEYVNNKEIVMNKLYHILNINNNMIKVSARDKNVVIKEIDNTIAENFLKNNHIQGYVGSSIHIGAYYKEVLIAVMSFTLEDKNKLKWNLTRFASDNKIICQGIGGKLFKYFIRNYEYKEVKSFADRRWTTDINDNLYIKLGFKLDKILSSDYKYITNDGELKHKFGFRKDKLHRKYDVPLTMTEKEMCDELGFYRVWDCGLLKYVYKNELLE